MKVKSRRRRQGGLRFPVSFLIHRCRWGCNSSTSSRSSDVIRDSLLESLSQETSFNDTTDLLGDAEDQDDLDLLSDDQINNEQSNNNRTCALDGRADSELLLGQQTTDSDEENESGAAGEVAMDDLVIHNTNNSSSGSSGLNHSPKDSGSNPDSSSRPRRRTLQDLFQIDIQRELRQPLSEVRENRSHPLYNFNHNLLPSRRRSDLAVQVNPLFNFNDRLARNNLCSPSSLIAHFMQSGQQSSEESDSSSLRLGDVDIDIFRSESQGSDSLPRDLPNNQNVLHNVNSQSNISSQSDNSDLSTSGTTQTSLSSALADNYSANLENVRFDFTHRMMALPTSGWLNNRIRGSGFPHRPRPRRQISNSTASSDGSTRRRPNVASYEINPINQNENLDNNSNPESRSGSRSSRNSSQSSGSRVPTTQNWYFYDPRLLPGNRENRVTVESNFRGVNTQFDVPTILSPPAYDEIGPRQEEVLPNQELDPPPPYSDGGSVSGRRSDTYSNQSIEGEPPPEYEQSFHHQLGEFSNFPREEDFADLPDNDIDSELSDSLSSVHLEDDIPSDGPCQAILDNFVLVAGSPSRNPVNPSDQSIVTPGDIDLMSLSSPPERNTSCSPMRSVTPPDRTHSPFAPIRSPVNVRPMSTSPIAFNSSPINRNSGEEQPTSHINSEDNANPNLNQDDNADLDQIVDTNPDDALEDQSTDPAVREFFSPPVTARSVFGGRPALRWSRNTSINHWMNTTQPWQM